jgi:hypothetical protein
MPLIRDEYNVADGQITVKYAEWTRVPGTQVEPFFVPAPQLSVDLGKGTVHYSDGEVTRSQIASPAATALTVTVERTVDTGATLFTVILPDSAVPGDDPEVAKVEAVAIITTIRTFLGNVGKEYPAECYRTQVLTGTYQHSVGTGVLPV